MANESQLGIRVTGMEITQFDLVQSFTPIQNFQFQFFVESRVQEERNMLIYAYSIKIFDKEKLDIPIGFLEFVMAFEIPNNFEKAAKKTSNGGFDIELELDRWLTTLGLDTLRGVAFSVFRGSYLQNVVLPLIDANSLQRQPNAKKAG
jgi:hypothetical protein